MGVNPLPSRAQKASICFPTVAVPSALGLELQGPLERIVRKVSLAGRPVDGILIEAGKPPCFHIGHAELVLDPWRNDQQVNIIYKVTDPYAVHWNSRSVLVEASHVDKDVGV